ncbi:MAG: helix-turn-helix transcriptional regulator [Clostridium sp.]
MGLKKIRESLNLTQEQLGAKCGTTGKTIYNIESGKGCNSKTLLQICKALNCKLEDIIKASEN